MNLFDLDKQCSYVYSINLERIVGKLLKSVGDIK